MIHIFFNYFLLIIYLQKNDLDTMKVVFCDAIGYVIGIYNFTLLKGSTKIFYIPSELSVFIYG